MDQLAQIIYQTGFAIFQALNTIVTQGTPDAQIAAALQNASGAAIAYEVRQQQMLVALQPFFPHYNPNWVAAYTMWVNQLIGQIQIYLSPIEVYGQQHGGHFDWAAIAPQAPDLMGYMGDLNVFRNPANYDQWQAPYVAASGGKLPTRDVPATPGTFDPKKVGIASAKVHSVKP